jgi:threonylcarbamoyladenosine tRNA methylthiotransferase MtaB
MIGHTDRYVRIAVCEEDERFKNAVSGQITTEQIKGFLNSDTLLI